ncbi:hypothetical protein [Bauldia sp.]|uniref:hypothetical protein n=1 Tax=Bauldia sp. TaxID=2575872 RepID=UPI003BADA6CA
MIDKKLLDDQWVKLAPAFKARFRSIDEWYEWNTPSEEEIRWLKAIAKEIPKTVYPNPLLPPWKEIPGVNKYSMAWRMGGGDGYLEDFVDWLRSLPQEKRDRYLTDNPEPAGWEDFYAENPF